MSVKQSQNKLPKTIFLLLFGLAIAPIVGCTIFNSNIRNDDSVVAQSSPKPTPQEIVQVGEVRALPGNLDTIPVFNSNSPEWVKTEGILLSTFPANGKKLPAAHLNFPFQGRFDLFAHHYTHTPKDLQTLYLGVILHNPGKKSVTVDVLQAASYLMEDAPFVTLPPYVENNDGKAYSGPGNRAVSDVLRGIRQADFPAKLVIPAGTSRMLLNHPIPVRHLEKPVNGRSSFMRLRSSGEIYAASLATFAKKNADDSDRAPTLAEWQALLDTGNLAGPRDKTPSSPDATSGQLIYGRVAGVSQGSQWQAKLVDDPEAEYLTIPQPGKGISYALDTLRSGRLGTEQNQTAKMLVRYADTAYEAHGNYGVEYNLNLPLNNNTNETQKVTITLETPLKEDKLSQGGVRFLKPSLDFPFFRGTVRLRYVDDQGQDKTRYVHLWHRTAQVLEPLLQVTLPPSNQRNVQLDLIYPPDSTPPQVVTVRTLEN
ncbi:MULTISPECIES: DUF3370 domain-containing protein [unclassified Nodularia (in: cyanobacteria)]|uniref:DUF3370 domain-containing protein n=1 Tax=unclassified Nodularia (in: cyanobacteria) TaxID=2656917 RepID=UPI00187FE084|nr:MULTISPECIES: DUF3370 domain-containing protein [unclassified Nodularia (in: cyanobacteria)]MBE9198315.1 DUF3370 domain-containing protein [Nodularia sp. LEGE 06071]MCC2693079.1 DUF3370 domain-containing protein [Nodularia sp. LEGE 04288]